MQATEWIELSCFRGRSADRAVLIGFAPANVLHDISFADVLEEETGRGYQRRLNERHSLDFRRYIQESGSTTIPLTFNVRPDDQGRWRIEERAGQLVLMVRRGEKPLAQVDCQHRLGHLMDISVELPFMCFLELTAREEMQIFNVINSKAKGLSSSLLDFHDAQLCDDLAGARPELYVALFLKNDASSPWLGQLDLGGTSGNKRRASLNTMQKAVRLFLAKSAILSKRKPDDVARIVRDFWSAVELVLKEAWDEPRKHYLNKAVGVYALMEIAADIYKQAPEGAPCDRKYFAAALSEFAPEFDWSRDGPLKGFGGEGGAAEAASMIREFRRRKSLRVLKVGRSGK